MKPLECIHVYMFFILFASDLGSSQQCCYDFFGNLITGVGGGAAYQVYPKDWKSTLSIIGFLYKYLEIVHYVLCTAVYTYLNFTLKRST